MGPAESPRALARSLGKSLLKRKAPTVFSGACSTIERHGKRQTTPLISKMPSRVGALRGISSRFDRGPRPGAICSCTATMKVTHLRSPLSHLDPPSARMSALVHRGGCRRDSRWCFPKTVSMADGFGNCQLLLKSRAFRLRCRGISYLRPRIRERRAISSGTVVVADACSESSTEPSSTGQVRHFGMQQA
jgi:hypothetical protein